MILLANSSFGLLGIASGSWTSYLGSSPPSQEDN